MRSAVAFEAPGQRGWEAMAILPPVPSAPRRAHRRATGSVQNPMEFTERIVSKGSPKSGSALDRTQAEVDSTGADTGGVAPRRGAAA